jgi:hypothetical protein
MPTYRFKDNNTGEVFDKWMYMAEREPYLEANPNLTQVPAGFTSISEVGDWKNTKVPGSFKDVLGRIKTSYPNSTFEV